MGDFKVRRGFSKLLKTHECRLFEKPQARRAKFDELRRTLRALKRVGRAQRSIGACSAACLAIHNSPD